MIRFGAPKKNPRADSFWLPLLSGRITATGAPSQKRLHSWKSAGVTDVVTLLRRDEMNGWLPDECLAVGINWHHFPLSGRNLGTRHDMETLARLPKLVSLLEDSSHELSVVVHCAAGLHRTGVFLYLLLRTAGFNEDETVLMIAQARPLAADELCKKTRKEILLERAAMIYQKLKD